ncbi:MAG: hypothetical protein H7338_10340 [Candidatus Sericytochromatia bacterium]|nr:hypothetical protein [Candidatus Sericytochromatia bacterium]
MADDPAVLLQGLRRRAGGDHLREWQIFPHLTERLRSGEESQPHELIRAATAVVANHPDIHARRWAMTFLASVAELRPETADSALRPLLAVLTDEAPDDDTMPEATRLSLWDAAVVSLADLAHRFPSLITPYRETLCLTGRREGLPARGMPVLRILDSLRQGMTMGLRTKTVRSTPRILDEATPDARFVIYEKDRYHTAHCRHLRRHVGVRLVPLTSQVEADSFGFYACASCHQTLTDGSVIPRPRPAGEANETLGDMPPGPVLTLVRSSLQEEPWTPPVPAVDFDPAVVPPPSAYSRLITLSQNQQRLVALWQQGDLAELSDVYRVIYARHHASMLQGPYVALATAALERAATGIPGDAWCAAQLVVTAAVAAFRAGDAKGFARVLAQRPETVFDYPFLMHLHGELAVVATPELLFAVRKLSGTRSSPTLKKQWARFTARCRYHVAAFTEAHGCDPVAYALRAGKGRTRNVTFSFGRDVSGDVRFLDVLHALPMAGVTGNILQAALGDLKTAKAPSKKVQRDLAQRAELEALHRPTSSDAEAVAALMVTMVVKAGAARIIAEQGLRAYEKGDMVKATAYLAKALAVNPQVPGHPAFCRALLQAATATGYAVGTGDV